MVDRFRSGSKIQKGLDYGNLKLNRLYFLISSYQPNRFWKFRSMIICGQLSNLYFFIANDCSFDGRTLRQTVIDALSPDQNLKISTFAPAGTISEDTLTSNFFTFKRPLNFVTNFVKS